MENCSSHGCHCFPPWWVTMGFVPPLQIRNPYIQQKDDVPTDKGTKPPTGNPPTGNPPIIYDPPVRYQPPYSPPVTNQPPGPIGQPPNPPDAYYWDPTTQVWMPKPGGVADPRIRNQNPTNPVMDILNPLGPLNPLGGIVKNLFGGML